MKKSLLIAALVLSVLTVTRQAGAVGFHHFEHSALSTGMGNARTALWDDASSLFFNPAAITELRGFQLSIGDTLFVPKGGYTPLPEDERTHGDLDGVNSSNGDERMLYPFHIFFTAETTSWLTLGISITNPFGLGSFWPEDWDGRFISTQMMLRTFFFQPAAAVSISRLLKLPDDILISFGIGVNVVYGDIMSRRQVDLSLFSVEGEAEATMKLDGTGHGFGANYALLVAWKPWFSIGFSARSNVHMNFSGDAGFSNIDPEIAEMMEIIGIILPESTGFNSSINLPWNMNLGIAFHGLKKFTFAVDLYIALWESYDELRVHFDCVDEGTCYGGLNDDAVFPKNWKKGYQICAGAEYR
ncbi:MAG: outer membrane protein transport protein, partial [Pseudomonadota bacterium]